MNLFFPGEWEVLIINEKIELNKNFSLSNTNYYKLKNRIGYYYADPFIYIKNGHFFLLCEEFSYYKNKGIISEFKLDQSKSYIPFNRITIEESYHLSFPFVFDFRGSNYLVPESSEKSVISAYFLNEQIFNSKELIFDDINAVDSVLFIKGDNIYLFTSLPGDFGVDGRGRIVVYVTKANDFPTTNWSKVPLLSLPLGRSAGNIISCNGKLFRLSQVSNNSYGEKIAVSEIEYLEADGFKEIFLYELNPNNYGGTHMHTFNICKDITVIDRKKISFFGILRTQYGRLIQRSFKLKKYFYTKLSN